MKEKLVDEVTQTSSMIEMQQVAAVNGEQNRNGIIMQMQQEMTLIRGKEMHVRKFDSSDADYAAIVAIDNAVWPEYSTKVENWKHWDSTREKEYRFQRWILESDGQMVAFGACGDRHWAHKPGHYFMDLNTLPDEEGHGFGSALFNHMLAELENMEPAPVQITSGTREDKERGLRFLEDRGYRQIMRFNRSLLDVQAYDPDRFQGKVERVRESGIAIRSLADLKQEDPEWLPKLYDLEWELLQDVPYHDDFTRQSYESFEKSILESPNFFPEAWAMALDGDRWIAFSALWKNTGNPKRLETGLTGVSRDYRRRGLATALKNITISYAQELGYQDIGTDNEENNPMYQINMQLGFVPQPAHLDFVKEME